VKAHNFDLRKSSTIGLSLPQTVFIKLKDEEETGG